MWRRTTAYAMGGRAMDASFVFSWPNATISMGGAFHLGQGQARDTESSVCGSPVRDAWYSSARLWDDGIISPLLTRDVLSRTLKIVNRQLVPRHDAEDGSGLGVLRM